MSTRTLTQTLLPNTNDEEFDLNREHLRSKSARIDTQEKLNDTSERSFGTYRAVTRHVNSIIPQNLLMFKTCSGWKGTQFIIWTINPMKENILKTGCFLTPFRKLSYVHFKAVIFFPPKYAVE